MDEICEHCGHDHDAWGAVAAKCDKDRAKALRTELDQLKEFARSVIKVGCWGIDTLDGGDIQELAERLGFIKEHTVTKDDVDEESDFEVGDIIYKFTEALERGK